MKQDQSTRFFKEILYAVKRRQKAVHAREELQEYIAELKQLTATLSDEHFEQLLGRVNEVLRSGSVKDEQKELKKRIAALEERITRVREKHTQRIERKKTRHSRLELSIIKEKLETLEEVYSQIKDNPKISAKKKAFLKQKILEMKKKVKEKFKDL
jgi:hypothetical protein